MAEAAVPNSPHITWSDSFSQGQSAIQSLSSILPSFPYPLLGSEDPSQALLHDPQISAQITQLLRQPDSGAGDNHLCRWFYDTFQFAKPDLQLVVLKFLPIIAGVYLSRVALRKPLAGFEAVLLALYAHETNSRNGQAITVNIPDLSHSSIYHETKLSAKNTATELNLAIYSPSLEPYGAVRSTRRARIVGVALELYYSKITEMPVDSKIAFCEFCVIWAGQDGEIYEENEAKPPDNESDKLGSNESNQAEAENAQESNKDDDGDNVKDTNTKEEEEEKVAPQCSSIPPIKQSKNLEDKEMKEMGRIPLQWELLQPVLRILGHCLMGPNKNDKLYEAACVACRSLYSRALHDINSKAILATGSLLRLVKMNSDLVEETDYTELTFTNVISL